VTETLRRSTSDASDWVACPRCRALVYRKRFARDLSVCPECKEHAPLTAPDRLAQLLDAGSAVLLRSAPVVADPLRFTDTRPYVDRLREARRRTGLDEAVLCARGTVDGCPVVIAVMDFRFLGGSLGAAVGEAITQAAEVALADRLPLVLVTASGGARMQEGVISLMQMAKTSQALAALDEAGVLSVAILTDPTYGGVAASYATVADVVLAEPGARMGFAGPRVIAETIQERLPDGFQTAEYLLAHGLIDAVYPRSELRATLARLVAVSMPPDPSRAESPVAALIRQPDELSARAAWDTVQLARHSGRPTTLDHVHHLLDGFVELHGDRVSGDCPAIVGGIGTLDGIPLVVVGHQKGHSTAELAARNFGMPHPEGYRQAARLMRLAAKLGIPVLTLIDTPGAHPGVEAEHRGQALAIAENLRLMSGLPVPIVAVITGEGGSGGALALGVADRVLACQNAFYSVISPEGCAAILWKSRVAAPTAATALRLDAADLLRLGVVEAVVPEPDGGAHRDPAQATCLLRDAVLATLDELLPLPAPELIRARRRRFRQFGLAEGSPAAGVPAGTVEEGG